MRASHSRGKRLRKSPAEAAQQRPRESASKATAVNPPKLNPITGTRIKAIRGRVHNQRISAKAKSSEFNSHLWNISSPLNRSQNDQSHNHDASAKHKPYPFFVVDVPVGEAVERWARSCKK